MVFRKLLLTVLVSAVCLGCEGQNPLQPGEVTITQSTSTTTTTTTSTIAPSTTAAFIFAPPAPAALQVVSFNAFGSSAAPGRTIASYSWDFGDGVKKTGQAATHDFASEGIYVVTLTVTDSAGDTASVSKPIGAGTPVPPVTTTSIPTSTAIRYVAPQADPSIPSDLTLFFQQLTSLATFTGLGPVAAAVGDLRYSVQGTYTTQNGRTGTIQGEFLGQLTPTPIGTFTGTLTANMPGCTATRAFSGPLTSASLQWTGGALLSNTCSTNPLEFSSLNLVKTDAPPPAPTTTIPATTTIVPTLAAGAISYSPPETGLAAATQYSFQFATPPSGGTPPYSYSWNFGDGSAAGSGAAPTHVFLNRGTFTVIVTVADGAGASGQAQTSVGVGNVAGGWTVTYDVSAQETTYNDALVLNQDQTVVTGTVDSRGNCGLAAATGSVSNVRSLTVNTNFCGDGSSIPVSYQGTLDGKLSTWTGSVSGPFGCPSTAPCPFVGVRTAGLTGRRR